MVEHNRKERDPRERYERWYWVVDVMLALPIVSIIDLSDTGRQPMVEKNVAIIVFNGEIYNYKEVRQSPGSTWKFKIQSDTECILAKLIRMTVR